METATRGRSGSSVWMCARCPHHRHLPAEVATGKTTSTIIKAITKDLLTVPFICIILEKNSSIFMF